MLMHEAGLNGILAVKESRRDGVMATSQFYAIVDYGDPYVQPLILAALKSILPANSYTLLQSLSEYPASGIPLLQFRSYETIDFEFALANARSLSNAYVIRKALIRKHFLSNTVSYWVTKHPSSGLKRHFKPADDFELDYAEFLDEALIEAYELLESFQENEGKPAPEREWWILKPGMSDRGQGIRLFSTQEELTDIFEQWDAEHPESDEEEDSTVEGSEHSDRINHSDRIITSHLRHFIAQPYIYPLLLFPSSPYAKRKFHIRTYVLAAGALRIYVYQPMLALFATRPYAPPWECFEDLEEMQSRTLTNTCLQSANQSSLDDTSVSSDSVTLFDHLGLTNAEKENVISQINSTTGEMFRAALAQATNFQPLPNSFELFGLDFLLDEGLNAWLLEVNAFPDFAQTGPELRDAVVEGLFEEVTRCVIAPFFGVGDVNHKEESEKLVKVLDVYMGRH